MTNPQEREHQADATFVSRRGKKVGMHELDMSGIDIEKDKSVRLHATKTKQTKTLGAKKAGPSRPASRRALVVFAIIVGVAIGVPLLAAELVTAGYRTGVSSAHEKLKSYVDSAVLPVQKKDHVKADELRTVARGVDGIAHGMCRGGLLDNIAALYPRAKDALGSCKAVQTEFSSLVANLFTLEAQLRTIERANVCLAPAIAPTGDGYAVLGAQRELWHKASECVRGMSPSDQLRKTHGELKKHVEAVADAWRRLDESNSSQDSAGFMSAEKELATEYEAVRATTADVLEVVRVAQQDVIAVYANVNK